jgi:hypothetical protein
MANIKAQVRKRTVPLMAWISFGSAVCGGVLAVGMWIGATVDAIVSPIPWPWLPAVATLGLLVAIVRDLLIDGEPNKIAVYGAIALPSLAAGAAGKLGDSIRTWSSAILDWVNTWGPEWLGTASAPALALAFIVTAILLAQRAVKKGKGSKATATAEAGA